MVIPARVSMVTLGVDDVARSTAFYEALGWRLSKGSAPGHVSFFHTAGGLLGLFDTNDLAADANLDPGPPGSGVTPSTHDGFRGSTISINVGSPAEVDAALAAAVAAGATLAKPAEPTDWGGYSGYFADPDGHAWEVAHNPFWPLNEAGLPALPD